MTKPKQPKIDRSGPGIAQEAPEAATVTSEPSNGSGRLRLEWRSPAELAENPRNWRTHPESQQAALAGVLSEVGWAGACLYNERTGRLIDGHLRRKVAQMQGAETLPVLVGDWSEADEAKILATLDPIAGLAECDPVRLRSVIDDVQTATQEVHERTKQKKKIAFLKNKNKKKKKKRNYQLPGIVRDQELDELPADERGAVRVLEKNAHGVQMSRMASAAVAGRAGMTRPCTNVFAPKSCFSACMVMGVA